MALKLLLNVNRFVGNMLHSFLPFKTENEGHDLTVV